MYINIQTHKDTHTILMETKSLGPTMPPTNKIPGISHEKPLFKWLIIHGSPSNISKIWLLLYICVINNPQDRNEKVFVILISPWKVFF